MFEDLGILYHVGGSFASSVHGSPRQTRDPDLVAEIEHGHVDPVVARLHERFYLDAGAVHEAIDRRASFNLIDFATGFKIDVFVRGESEFDRSEFSRHRPETLSPDSAKSVNVKSPEDTVLRKLLWFEMSGRLSDRQWSDVQGILRAQSDRLDDTYLREWATQLGIDSLLEAAR